MLPVAPGATYRWDVPLEIHSNAMPYENTQHGRMYQSIRVGLEWETGQVYRKVVAEKVSQATVLMPARGCRAHLTLSLVTAYLDHLYPAPFQLP